MARELPYLSQGGFMNIRKFALFGGVVMLVLGVFSLAQGLSTFPDWLPSLQINSGYGVFLNILPMNIVNKVLLIAFGIAGVVIAQPRFSAEANVRYAKSVFYFMGILAVLGLFRYTNTLFGIMPLMRGEVVAHGIFALLGGYFSFKHGELPLHEQLA